MECVYRSLGLSAMLTQANTIFTKVYQFHEGFFFINQREMSKDATLFFWCGRTNY